MAVPLGLLRVRTTALLSISCGMSKTRDSLCALYYFLQADILLSGRRQSAAFGSHSHEQQAHTSSTSLKEQAEYRSSSVQPHFSDVRTLQLGPPFEQRSSSLIPATPKRPLDAQNNGSQSLSPPERMPYRLFGSLERKAEIQVDDNQNDVKTITNIIIDFRDPSSWQRR